MVNSTSTREEPMEFPPNNGTGSKRDRQAEMDCPISVCKKKIPLGDLWSHIPGNRHSPAAMETNAMRRLLDLPGTLAFCAKGVETELAYACGMKSGNLKKNLMVKIRSPMPHFHCPTCHAPCASPRGVFSHWGKILQKEDHDHFDKFLHLKAELKRGV